MASSLDVCSVCTLTLSVLLNLKLKFIEVTKHHTISLQDVTSYQGLDFIIIRFFIFLFFFLLCFYPFFSSPMLYVRVEVKKSIDIIRFPVTYCRSGHRNWEDFQRHLPWPRTRYTSPSCTSLHWREKCKAQMKDTFAVGNQRMSGTFSKTGILCGIMVGKD